MDKRDIGEEETPRVVESTLETLENLSKNSPSHCQPYSPYSGPPVIQHQLEPNFEVCTLNNLVDGLHSKRD